MKDYINFEGLSNFLDNLFNKFSTIGHKHNYCDSFDTSASDAEGVWTVNIDGITELYDGLTIKM